MSGPCWILSKLTRECSGAAISSLSPQRPPLPENTKVIYASKHLPTHIFVFSLGLALENVQNHSSGLKTHKVMLNLFSDLEKGQILPLPLVLILKTYLVTLVESLHLLPPGLLPSPSHPAYAHSPQETP